MIDQIFESYRDEIVKENNDAFLGQSLSSVIDDIDRFGFSLDEYQERIKLLEDVADKEIFEEVMFGCETDGEIKRIYFASGKSAAERIAEHYLSFHQSPQLSKYIYLLARANYTHPKNEFFYNRLVGLLTLDRYESRYRILQLKGILLYDAVKYLCVFIISNCKKQKRTKYSYSAEEQITITTHFKDVFSKKVVGDICSIIVSLKFKPSPPIRFNPLNPESYAFKKAEYKILGEDLVEAVIKTSNNYNPIIFKEAQALIFSALVHKHKTNDRRLLDKDLLIRLLKKYHLYDLENDVSNYLYIISRIVSRLRDAEIQQFITVEGSLNAGWKLILKNNKAIVSLTDGSYFLHTILPDDFLTPLAIHKKGSYIAAQPSYHL